MKQDSKSAINSACDVVELSWNRIVEFLLLKISFQCNWSNVHEEYTPKSSVHNTLYLISSFLKFSGALVL